MQQTISITVSGKVQGVFYRQSTREKARELGLAGHVQNMPDGSVHILATGPREKLDQLISWCHQGPPRSRVTSVKITDLPYQEFNGFHILS